LVQLVRVRILDRVLVQGPAKPSADPDSSELGSGGTSPAARSWSPGSDGTGLIICSSCFGGNALRRRALNQAARELMLAQSSDWAFIMKMGTVVEYACERTKVHVLNFNHLYEQIKKDYPNTSVADEADRGLGTLAPQS